MITFTKKRLNELFQCFRKQKIVVVGDLMLDQYLWGSMSRISPEAPVPVVDIQSESFRFGGAANVCFNVQTLGAEVIPVGVIGGDQYGTVLKGLFEKNGLMTDGIFIDKERPTTLKTRIIAHSQHVVRTDREIRRGLSKAIQDKILTFIQAHINDFGGIILEDYNKGVLSTRLIQEITKLAQQHHKMVFVDPKRDHFFDYREATLFKPNRKEVADNLRMKLDSDADIIRAGEKIMDQLQCKAVLITLGEEGMMLFQPGKSTIKVPTRAVKVHDVSGAGDTVIATMAVSMIAGAALEEAATIANHAAGIVCGEVGIVPIDRKQLLDDLLDAMES
jgi:rfaE bifunctional protein kinase chain/domain